MSEVRPQGGCAFLCARYPCTCRLRAPPFFIQLTLPESVGGCMGRADLFSCSLQILGSPISLILKSEMRHIPVGARRTRCQLEHWSKSAAPSTSPHGGPAGVGDGGMRIPSLDSPISNQPKTSSIIRTAHAPSHAPPPALALMVGCTCIFSSRRPEAVGRWMGLTNTKRILSGPLLERQS